jgi:predicted phage tail protein
MSQALIDELSKAKYASMSDQAAADAINELTVTVRKPVELWQVEEHASRRGYRAKLERASKTEGHPCQEVALNILAYINSARLNTVDMDLADTQQMVGAMVQCQFATQAMADELLALADQTIKWTESVGLPEIGVGLVRNARKKMGVQ